jgi:tetratricopeptide (TPR) repeat protein
VPDPVRTWTPRLVAVAGFSGYALAAPPGPTWLDAGEIGAASFQLGSPHPTGFPLEIALAKLMTLLPVGELAFRLHLVSAAAAAIALALVAALVAEAGGNGRAACAAGAAAALLVGVSLTFARQASTTEVYAPTAALLAGGLYLYDRVARGADARWGLALALVAGLAFGVHVSFRLLLGLPILFLLFVRLRRGARWPLLAPVVAVAAAAAVQLCLPVRSATGRTAAVDWGHPRSAVGLIDHVTAAEIRESHGDEMLPHEPMVVREHAARFLGETADQLGALALLAAVLGAIHLARDRRSRWLLGALVAVAVGDALYAIALNPMGIADGQNGVPLALAVGVLAGMGLVWLGRFAGRAGSYAAAGAGAILVVAPVMVSWPALASGGDAPRRFAEAALDAAPSRAVLLTRSDSLSAGVLFLQVAEGARPDVAALVRQRLGDRARNAAIVGAPADLKDILGGARPVVWEPGDDPVPRGFSLRAGPVAGLVGPPAAGDVPRAAAELVALFAGASDPIAERTFAHALTSLGRLAFERGDIALALQLFDRAIAARPDHVEALVNRGAVLSRMGRLVEAAEVTERALAVEPNRMRALINAARYRGARGDNARAHAERALRLDPRQAEAAATLRALDRDRVRR